MLSEQLFIAQMIAAMASLIPFLATFWFKKSVEVTYYRGLVLITCAWSVLYGLEMFLPSLDDKILVMQVRQVIQPFASVFTVLLAANHFRWPRLQTTRMKLVLVTIPVLTVFVVLTTRYHQLFRYDFFLEHVGELTLLGCKTGIWFYVFGGWAYILLILTMIISLNAIRGVNRTFARQGILFFLVILIPIILDSLYQLHIYLIPGFNMSSTMFIISGILIFMGFFRYRMLDIRPIARAEVMMQMDDPVMVFDDGDRLVDFNRAATSAFAWVNDERLGSKIEEILPHFMPAMASDDATGRLREIERPLLDKRLVYEVKTTNVMINGAVSERIVILRDVTARREAADALKENERKYRELLERTPFPIVISALENGEIMYVNERAEKQFHVEHQGMLGGKVHGLFAERDGLDRLKTAIADCSKIADVELRMSMSDGRPFWAHISAMMMSFEERDVLFMALNDISERKHMEDALRVMNSKLMLLTSITRHDLMNQLTAVHGYLQLAQDSDDQARVSKLLDRMEVNVGSMQTLIQFTKAYQEIGVTAPGWYDLQSLIDEAISKLNASRTEVVSSIDGVEVYGDALLEKVFYNLMENSIRHGGEVTRISIDVEDREFGKVIVYRDDGVGIRPEDKERIFKRGFGKNTGLGLFFSREVLAITGMTIVENGEMGKGVRFEIFVPDDSFHITG